MYCYFPTQIRLYLPRWIWDCIRSETVLIIAFTCNEYKLLKYLQITDKNADISRPQANRITVEFQPYFSLHGVSVLTFSALTAH